MHERVLGASRGGRSVAVSDLVAARTHASLPTKETRMDLIDGWLILHQRREAEQVIARE